MSGVDAHDVDDDRDLLTRLRAGDDAAFETLVRRNYPTMLRVARHHVRTDSVAEEVVQEAWAGALTALDRFEERSSLRTWLVRITIHKAISRGVREARTIPFSSLGPDDDSTFQPDRFRPEGGPFPGHWNGYPSDWSRLPEDVLGSKETLEVLRQAVAALPPAQSMVMTLRDLDGWDAAEVCDALQISDGNQRVLLHRARCAVRRALEQHFEESAHV